MVSSNQCLSYMKDGDMTTVILDTETTGFEDDDSIVELGLVYEDGSTFSTLVKPTCRIKYPAMAAHGITEDLVADAPEPGPLIEEWVEPADIIVAHNAEFDRKFFPRKIQKKTWICTYKCARVLIPDAESHSNMSLRYELGLDISDMPKEAGNMPHRALYDAWVTKKLYDYLLTLAPIDKLINISQNPILLREVKFGKHRGMLWKDVDHGYLQWILRNGDFDDDTIYTAKYHLGLIDD